MEGDGEMANKKKHSVRKSGRKAEKKKAKDEKKRSAAVGSSAKAKGNVTVNHRAFAIQNINKARRKVVHALDRETHKHHNPIANRTNSDTAPPVVIAVVGPSKVGKTTLIRSMVKRYTKHTLKDINGPVTVVAGKNRRLTFIECNNDLNSMMDVAKICDLALLLIDGSFGFEMETFEFLNMLLIHGMPRIMGVLTHLDKMKTAKQLRQRKKELKDRFKTEIAQGSKLFYLSTIIDGMYPQRDINNLARFISVMKFRPLMWRNSHPYLLVDRLEDVTDPEDIRLNKKCDRKVSLYGYVRGTILKQGQKMHMPEAETFASTTLSS
eukprot:m.195475 g.195475  ORF g.195475 m.195475 type:complete len:323 (+) comp13667_c2_seq5:161-1129(+)